MARSSCAAVLALWLVPFWPVATQAQSAPSPVTAGDIDHIQQQRIYFDAMAAMEASRAKVSPSTSARIAPTAKFVQGSGPSASAVLEYETGSIVQARVGEKIPDGYQVRSMTLDKVILVGQDGKDVVLTVGGE